MTGLLVRMLALFEGGFQAPLFLQQVSLHNIIGIIKYLNILYNGA